MIYLREIVMPMSPLMSALQAASCMFVATTSVIAQDQRVAHLNVLQPSAGIPLDILKVASSCRSKCLKRVKRCKRKCPKGSTWAQECKHNCSAAYSACKNSC